MKRNSKGRNIFVLLSLTFVAIFALIVFGSNLFTSNYSHLDQLVTGWSVKYGDKEYTDISIADMDTGGYAKGEIVSFTRTLEPVGIVSPTLMFKSKHTVVDVYLDGKRIYTFGREWYQQGKFVPKVYNMVSIVVFCTCIPMFL